MELESEDESVKTKSKFEWTEQDKRLLLKGIKQHGHYSLTKLRNFLPHKSESAIRTKISKIIGIAKEKNKIRTKEGIKVNGKKQDISSTACLNRWAESKLLEEKDEKVSLALRCINLFEKQPALSEENKCDFGSIYKFLYQLSIGRIPAELTPETKAVFYSVLSEVIRESTINYHEDVFDYLGKLSAKQNIKNVYPGKRRLNVIDPALISK